MIRCPRCGHRLKDAAPVCRTHGEVTGDLFISQTPGSLPPPEAVADLGYRSIRLLGRGGYGAVYLAEPVSGGAAVAVKLTAREEREASESLLREAEMLRSVGAPHVPEVYQSGANDRYAYVVMERVTMPTLADRLVAQEGPAPLDTLERLAYSLLAPLEAMHAQGIVHRDLKPENIFVPDDGPARIIDFGLAQLQKLARESLEVSAHSATAQDAGTAEYMSPEQCEGIVDADRRSDIYSVGVLLYEILSGAPPFWGRAADVREAHRSKRPVPLSLKVQCPAELDQLIRRCLSKDRKQRFEDVPSLRRALEVALSARMPSRAPQPRASSPGVTLSKPAAPAPIAREKRAMGLVFFESRGGVGAVQGVVTAAGGQIVQTNGAQYVAAFGHDVGDNPARTAVVAAHRLASSKLAQRLLVDVATVSVQNRPDGSRRIWSAVLTKADRFPTQTDPAGVLLSAAAADVLPDLEPRALPDRADRFVLPLTQSANELTTLGIEVAPLLGRDAERTKLMASADRAAKQSLPTLVTVLGAAGYGRSHLAGALARELDRSPHGFELIRLTAQEGVVSASQVMPELLRRLLELPTELPQPDQARALLTAKLGDLGEGV